MYRAVPRQGGPEGVLQVQNLIPVVALLGQGPATPALTLFWKLKKHLLVQSAEQL